jgi:FkbM family methyltransferase
VAEFDGFVNNASEGMILFDIGAHFGLFSIAALHYGGKKARAVAVDPSPVAVRLTRIQARLNQVADRLCIVQASVAAHTGQQSMVAVGVLANGFYVAPGPEHSAGEVVHTNAITLDSLAEETQLLPTHIKIDVEGSEAAVLRGAERLLAEQPAPMLFLELHNEIISRGGGDPRETLMLLRNAGYEMFRVDGGEIAEAAILDTPLIRIIAKRVPGLEHSGTRVNRPA